MLLRPAAAIELGSLLVLLLNLATVHWQTVAGLVGPLHGCAYLVVIGATVHASRDLRTRLTALVPGIGGLLATRRLAATNGGKLGTFGPESPSATDR
ncbi:hypothetical protein [Actinoplanes sp. N902-109]|uniref:hypothetical protein n=1 Tax=Actinoplanes sp. (strain N902-109) TaxID=649831 RepID=UPI00032955DE|nr:hypothetical protein [Actinoplanes sp. N902-109]AGL20631.1 hypothetical protein L083_7121 [Actinoplanes sp. N902-109]